MTDKAFYSLYDIMLYVQLPWQRDAVPHKNWFVNWNKSKTVYRNVAVTKWKRQCIWTLLGEIRYARGFIKMVTNMNQHKNILTSYESKIYTENKTTVGMVSVKW